MSQDSACLPHAFTVISCRFCCYYVAVLHLCCCKASPLLLFSPFVMVPQNPTLSACWCVGLCQIMIPVISFSVDTTPFCKSVSRPVAFLFLVYSIFAFLCNLLGPTWFDVAHVFRFYKFPFSFTSWWDLRVWAFLFLFVLLIPIMRKLLDRHERRSANRIVPLELR